MGELAEPPIDDGWISDESDFVGSKSVRLRLDRTARDTPLSHIIKTWQLSRAATPQVQHDTLAANDNHTLVNVFEGNPAGRQLSETIDEFVKRLPPGNCSLAFPWIWISNPQPQVQGKGKGRAYKDLDHGISDTFRERASAFLEEYDSQQAQIESSMQGKAKGTITRKLTPLRTKLKEKLLQVAVEERCVCGKWMLFPAHDEVIRTWKLIAQGVIDNRLGHTAKVATTPSGRDSERYLICIYTKDFSDKSDVSRVLMELVRMGLCPAEGHGIYYKCDAYTYLGIESDNPYGLKASLYSSKDVLAEEMG